MDIHAPEGPTNSFKDFLIHIVIVTIGILIALGLEGIRETIHEHSVVREARDNFQAELQTNKMFLEKELKNDNTTLAQLDQLVADLPKLRLNPAQLRDRLLEIKPSGYFFTSSRWESALSTGALGYMPVDEVDKYAQINLLVHTYTGLEGRADIDWQQLEAYFSAHESPNAQELNNGIEKIFIYRADTKSLKQVAEEFSDSLDRALEHH